MSRASNKMIGDSQLGPRQKIGQRQPRKMAVRLCRRLIRLTITELVHNPDPTREIKAKGRNSRYSN
jgi:hypothetical protein